MKIAFVWYFDKAEWVFPNWRDGLRGAMEEIGKVHEVDWIVGKKLPNYIPDFLLFWDDSNSEVFSKLHDFPCRKGICLTTDPQNFENLRMLDAVFCESTPIVNAVRSQGIRAIKAFGTDTDFFKPDPSIKKDIKYFYPATFSPWKKQSEIAHYGDQLLCIGTVQPDGVGELEECRKHGVRVEEGYFPAEKIREYYQRSQSVVIPAVHGSERTVLESMACGVFPVVLSNHNVRAKSYVEEYVYAKEDNKDLTLRDFVVNNYSHKVYAKQLLKGIET